MFAANARLTLLAPIAAALITGCASEPVQDAGTGSAAYTGLPDPVVVLCDAEGTLSQVSKLAPGGKAEISVFDGKVGVGTVDDANLPPQSTAYITFTKADGGSPGLNSEIKLDDRTCTTGTYADRALTMTEFGLWPTRLSIDFDTGDGAVEQYDRYGGGCRDNGFDRVPVKSSELRYTVTLSNCVVRPAR